MDIKPMDIERVNIERMNISRRRFIVAVGATSLLTLWPRVDAFAAANDTRLLVVLLRGAMDGLHAMPPIGEPAYASLRGGLAVRDPLKLDGLFGMHPSLKFMHELYGKKQLLPLVATAPPYRQRSHFDAQDCLENGTTKPGGSNEGWLSRCVAAMPSTEGLAVASVMPLIMRGPGDITTWSPPLPEQIDPVLLRQLQQLYAADPVLSVPFAKAAEDRMGEAMGAGGRGAAQLPQTMAAAARFMIKPDGPRIGFVEDTGWDTHGNQAPALTRKFNELDAGLRAYAQGAGETWKRSVVAIVTEFGRTAKANGTGGTDHGTGGIAFLAGGAVRGGRIAGDWPGLSQGALNEGRDLRTTTDMRALFKGVLGAHLGLSEGALESSVFPGSRGVRPLENLIV